MVFSGTESIKIGFADAGEISSGVSSVTADLEAAYDRTGCLLDRKVKPNGSPAVYVPFMYNPGEGNNSFVNTMLMDLERDEHKVIISRRHEAIHAVQWNSVPVLHASPYNSASRVILSPESWILMTLLTERDAYAKTAWLNAVDVLQGAGSEFKMQAAREPVAPADVDLQNSETRKAIQNAATCWDLRLKHKHADDEESMTLLDHYIQQALRSYENGHALRSASENFSSVTYIRLTPEDIFSIGKAFGPSTFGDYAPDPMFTRLPLMRPDLWDRLQDLNRKHGIYSEAQLPTLSQALSPMGLTPESYMAISKAHIPSPVYQEPQQALAMA
ncbi:MAG: hypothetical protein LRZ85_02595 [Alphaproteobacteria bacterium]|nr:hypothetical protein [Alphaproteobacteria bacterium]MCD8519770.1 hypothetical protein [Alphaproteobacteria bacterium]